MTADTEDVRSELSQDEKRETLLNDQRVREQAGTFMSHTHPDEGGRFAKARSKWRGEGGGKRKS